MLKTVYFKEDHLFKLEEKVNDFIKYKIVVNISYSFAQYGYVFIHCCCVLYNSFS